MENVFHSQQIHDVVEKAAKKFEIPENQIHPIKNYVKETETVLSMDILTLYNLQMVINMCYDSDRKPVQKIDPEDAKSETCRFSIQATD